MIFPWLITFLSEKKERFVCLWNRQKAISFFRHNRCKLIKPRHCLFSSKQVSLGKSIRFDEGARIDCYTSDAHISIGDFSFFAYNVSLLSATRITIGSNCLFASYVLVTDENHGTAINGGPYLKQPLSTKPVEIGNNVWLGEKVIVLPGVKIGDNCIIGAGSIVTTDIPENSLAVGNPAKVVKQYNKDSQIWEKV